MDSNILKEAIADAKAVRQTALANAKVALEEAFSERYHAMFAEKLKEDAEQESTGGNMTGIAAQPEENVSEQEIDELIKELEAEVGGEQPHAEPDGDEVPGAVPPMGAPAGLPPVGGSPLGAPPLGQPPVCVPPAMPAAPGVAPVPPMGAPVGGEVPPMGAPMGAPPVGGEVPPAPGAGVPPSDVPPMGGAEEEDEDVDLNELLETLKEEVEEGYEEEEEENKKLQEMKKLDTSAIGPGKSSNGGNKKPSAVASSSSDIESGGLDGHGQPGSKVTCSGDDATEVTKPEKNFDGNKDGNLAKTPKIHESTSIDGHGQPGSEVTSNGDDATEVTKPEKNFDGNKDGNLAKTPHLTKENATLKKQLKEAYETITYVKGQLNEINLLNAKLLFTNKLFKEYNMNNEQKMRVVEMFDLAKNVREVKLTFANIAESLNFSGTDMKRKVVNQSHGSVQALTEGLASKPVGSTKPSKQIISESRSMASRFQELAGIKKK